MLQQCAIVYCRYIHGQSHDTVAKAQLYQHPGLEVKNLPKSATVTMQEALVLEIPVKGRPRPSITWMKGETSYSMPFVHNHSPYCTTFS